MRLFVLCLCLAFATACKKAPSENAPAAPAAVPATPVAEEAPPSEAEPMPQAVEPEEETPEIASDEEEEEDDDEEVIVTRIDASMVEPFLAYRSAVDAVGPGAVDDSGRRQVREKVSAAREKSNLSDREAEALDAVMNEVLRSTSAGSAGADVAPDARAKYGNEVVDAMLARIDELKKLGSEEDALARQWSAQLAKAKRKMLLTHATLADNDAYMGDDWAYFAADVDEHFHKTHPEVVLGTTSDGTLSPALANHLMRKLVPDGMGYLLINGDRSTFVPHNLPDEVITEANEFFGF